MLLHEGLRRGRVEVAGAAAHLHGHLALVQHLGVVLDELPAGVGLQKLLDTFPAAAMVYENRHYCHAGLCRAPLDLMVRSERQTQALLSRL